MRDRPREKNVAAKATLPLLLLLLASCGDPDQPVHDRAAALGDGSVPLEIRRQPGLDVLLITIDTLRADALGAYGDAAASTPWIDRLASQGVRFDNARAHSVNTLPSHATILSGLYPQEHGVRDNSGFRFPEGIETLATLLEANDYRTGAFVSAFPLDSQFGLARGFEVYEDSFVDAGVQTNFLVQEREGTETVRLASEWLDSGDPRPAFAWIHLFEPHFPYAPPETLVERFRSDPYRGDVAAADAALAPLLEPLLDLGKGTDTLIVLTSDHGEALGEHGEPTHGIFAYESVLKVPLILHQPKLLPAAVVSRPARLVDLLPTVLDLLALDGPPDLRGRSLLPSIFGEAASGDPGTYFEALSAQLNLGWAPLHGVIRDDWKYIALPIPELYDLESDPHETINLATAEPQRRQALEAALAELLAIDTGAVPEPESPETRRRLQALGYLGSGSAPAGRDYGEDDDPKRLIPLFRMLRDVGSLHGAGDLAAARSLCREIIGQRPDMRMAFMYLGQIERDLGNADAAAKAMRKAVELKPDDDEALALLASYLMQAGRPLDAVQATETHSRLERPNAEVLLTRGLALARVERQAEALSTLARARALDPTNPMIPVYVGTLHLMAGQRNQAREAYESALAINPETVRAHTSLATMASEEGRLDEALAHWRRSLEIDPQQSALLYSAAGGLWNGNRKAAARSLLQLFVQMAPATDFRDEIRHARRLLDQSN